VTTTNDAELRECPFHKPEPNRPEVVSNWFAGERYSFWAGHCEACGARGPEEKTREEAIAAWNQCALPALPAAQSAPTVDVCGVAEAGERSYDKFLATIADGLRHAVRDHGAITKELIGSAAKRVMSRLRNTRYDPLKATRHLNGACGCAAAVTQKRDQWRRFHDDAHGKDEVYFAGKCDAANDIIAALQADTKESN
jgi:hypothetical protein